MKALKENLRREYVGVDGERSSMNSSISSRSEIERNAKNEQK